MDERQQQHSMHPPRLQFFDLHHQVCCHIRSSQTTNQPPPISRRQSSVWSHQRHFVCCLLLLFLLLLLLLLVPPELAVAVLRHPAAIEPQPSALPSLYQSIHLFCLLFSTNTHALSLSLSGSLNFLLLLLLLLPRVAPQRTQIVRQWQETVAAVLDRVDKGTLKRARAGEHLQVRMGRIVIFSLFIC